MESDTIPIALTFCLVASSATGYLFGLLTSENNTKKYTNILEKKINNWLEDPKCYEHDRSIYANRR